MCEYNNIPLENVENYIEMVRGKLPEQYRKYYSYLHTYLCCEMRVKTCEWMQNYEYECPKYGQEKCDAYQIFCEIMEEFDISGANHEKTCQILEYEDYKYLSILCNGDDIRFIIEHASINGHEIDSVKCIHRSFYYPFGSCNHSGIFKIDITHQFENKEDFDWDNNKDEYGLKKYYDNGD